ncbi:MAG: hypothetical protein AABY22_24095, partial [Nanoarchaeota archaeon]
VINANEISAKIRPFFETLSNADHTSSTAAYIDKKYILSYPSAEKSIVFDRERLSFWGPWTATFGINKWASFRDSDGIERWIAIDADDSYVTEFTKSLKDDKGTAFRTIFKTRKEDFGDWTVFKTVNELYSLFRNVIGSLSVNIYLEDRSGLTITAASFSVTSQVGKSGIGTDQMGLFRIGLTNNDASPSSDELPKRTLLYKTGRTIQMEIQTTGRSDNYELLALKFISTPQPRAAPVSWNT